jgi:hypothetical protein
MWDQKHLELIKVHSISDNDFPKKKEFVNDLFQGHLIGHSGPNAWLHSPNLTQMDVIMRKSVSATITNKCE